MTTPSRTRLRSAPLLVAIALALAACDGSAQAPAARVAARELPALSDSAWSALVLSLSEEPGFFDTDNLISNERSYLHVLAPLRRMRGGAYLGVGPDQSFSYLAAARPAVAFIIDIRRDNLLHHLLLRSLFALSSNRAEYLARLHGRTLPADPRAWDGRLLEDILARVDSLPVDPAAARATAQAVDSLIRGLPLPITEADFSTIHRFHREFIQNGTALRFQTLGRAPRPYYPTFRDLLLEKDAAGRPGSFLYREEDFRWVKSLEARNLVVPVVGDLAGPHALLAIASWLKQKGVGVSEYYTSNVEDYVWQDGKYAAFVANVRALPWEANGVIIRSYFHDGRTAAGLEAPPGYYSSQILQPIGAFLKAADALAASRATAYEQVITAGMLDLR